MRTEGRDPRLVAMADRLASSVPNKTSDEGYLPRYRIFRVLELMEKNGFRVIEAELETTSNPGAHP